MIHQKILDDHPYCHIVSTQCLVDVDIFVGPGGQKCVVMFYMTNGTETEKTFMNVWNDERQELTWEGGRGLMRTLG